MNNTTTNRAAQPGNKLTLTTQLISAAIAAGCDLADVGLLAYLIDRTWWNHDDNAWSITLAQITLANRLNVSPDTIARRAAKLERANVIRRSNRGPRDSTRYTLVPPSIAPASSAPLPPQTPQASTLRLRTPADSDSATLPPQTPHGCKTLQAYSSGSLSDSSAQQQQQRHDATTTQTPETPCAAAAVAGESLRERTTKPQTPATPADEDHEMIIDTARALLIRPRWLASEKPWLDDRTAARLAAMMTERMHKTGSSPAIELFRVLTEARRRSSSMHNVVGYIVNELTQGMPPHSPVNWPRELDTYTRAARNDPRQDVHAWLLRLGEPEQAPPQPDARRYA